MWKRKSTILIEGFFSPRRKKKTGKKATWQRVLESRALKNPRPVFSSSTLHFSWKGKNMPMKSLVFGTSHTDFGIDLLQVLPAHHCFSSGSRGVPKWYSKPDLSWHFNDLGIPSPLMKDLLYAWKGLCTPLFRMFCYFYTNIMIFSGRKKAFLKQTHILLCLPPNKIFTT